MGVHPRARDRRRGRGGRRRLLGTVRWSHAGTRDTRAPIPPLRRHARPAPGRRHGGQGEGRTKTHRSVDARSHHDAARDGDGQRRHRRCVGPRAGTIESHDDRRRRARRRSLLGLRQSRVRAQRGLQVRLHRYPGGLRDRPAGAAGHGPRGDDSADRRRCKRAARAGVHERKPDHRGALRAVRLRRLGLWVAAG